MNIEGNGLQRREETITEGWELNSGVVMVEDKISSTSSASHSLIEPLNIKPIIQHQHLPIQSVTNKPLQDPKAQFTTTNTNNQTLPTIKLQSQPITNNGLSESNPFLALSDSMIDRLVGKEKEVYDILEHQLDVELFERKKELNVIESELRLGNYVLDVLRRGILKTYANPQKRGASTSVEGLDRFQPPNTTRNLVSFNKKAKYGPKVLFCKREDGIFVRLVCPECGRPDFANIQGFINHCRISHTIDFPTHQEAALACGIPVPESDVPLDHTCRRTHIKPVVNPLKSKIEFGCGGTLYRQFQAAKADLLSNKPKIKVYEEDVHLDDDMESDDGSTTNRSIASSQLHPPSRAQEDDAEPKRSNGKMLSRYPLNSELHNQSNLNQGEINQVESTGTSSTKITEPLKAVSEEDENEDRESISTAISVPLAPTPTPTLSVPITEVKKEIKSLSQHQGMMTGAPPFVPVLFNGNINPGLTNLIKRVDPIPPVRVGQDTSLSARLGLDHGSRFYIKKRIIVGNVSKYIPPDNRNVESNYFRWMVYISGPSYDPDLSGFISKVRIFLHPSYKPDDVVDLDQPPFNLKRYGWGEFPLRIQLHFFDPRNKPVDFIHQLKLDHTLSGSQVLGDEKMLDVELDRSTRFRTTPSDLPPTVNSPITRPPTLRVVSSTNEADLAPETVSQPLEEEIDTKEKIDWVPADFGMDHTIHELLLYLLRNYPMISQDPSHILPFKVARTCDQYQSFNLGRRKATEYSRCLYLKRALLSEVEEQGDSMGRPTRLLANYLTTKQLINWARVYDKTIAPLNLPITLVPLGNRLANRNHCRACGVFSPVHVSGFCHDCAFIEKGASVTTLTKPDGLLNTLPLGWDSLFDDTNSNQSDSSLDLIVIDDEPTPTTLSRMSPQSEHFVSHLSNLPPTSIPSILPSFIKPWELKEIILEVKRLKLSRCISNVDERGKELVAKLGHVTITLATRLFLSKLINRVVTVYRQQELNNTQPLEDRTIQHLTMSSPLGSDNDKSAHSTTRKITPVHLFKALTMKREEDDFDNMDFLTNSWMGTD